MSHATQKLRSYAGNLIRHEAAVNASSLAQPSQVLPVLEKLRPLLATFMGRAGYHALISRALTLARDEAPWLCEVAISEDGSPANLAELAGKHDAAEVSHGCEVLLAQLIGLLIAFIGEVLTLRMIHELWPDLDANEDFTQGNENEQSN